MGEWLGLEGIVKAHMQYCAVCWSRWEEGHVCPRIEPLPPLTFRPEEWRMRVPGAQHDPVYEAMAELGREDAIMSAVRAVARGS